MLLISEYDLLIQMKKIFLMSRISTNKYYLDHYNNDNQQVVRNTTLNPIHVELQT